MGLLVSRGALVVPVLVSLTVACASLDGLSNGSGSGVATDGGDALGSSVPDAHRDAKADVTLDAGHGDDATLDASEGGDVFAPNDADASFDAAADVTLDAPVVLEAADARDDGSSHDAAGHPDARPDVAAPRDAHDAAEAAVDAGLPDSSVCNSNVVHLASDSDNCGACGHGCQGGACMDGACQPVVVTSGSWGIGAVAADDTNVYWVENENESSGQADIFSLAFAVEGAVPQEIAPLQDNPTPMIPSGGLLYYGLIYTQTIVSLSPSGTVATLTTNAGMPQGVAVDEANVYWTDIQRQAVMAVPLAGGTVTTIAPGAADMTSIAVDATSVYWCEPTANAVVKASKAGGGTPVTLSTLAPTPETILLQGGQAYFSADESPFEAGGIYRLAPDGTGLTRIAAPLGGAYYAAIDSSDAYWTGLGVGKAPLAGGTTTTLVATGQTYGLAVTPNSLFWVEAGTPNTFMRLAK